MNADTSGRGQIVPFQIGINFTKVNAGTTGTMIDANNSDDCDAYGSYYDQNDPCSGANCCDCTTKTGMGKCETICDVHCTNNQCERGFDANRLVEKVVLVTQDVKLRDFRVLVPTLMVGVIQYTLPGSIYGP